MARYHSLRIWKLAIEIVKETQLDISSLKGEADLRDQMKRSSRSIVANICEGSEQRTDKEYKHFLVIARGSAAELLSWYEVIQAIGFMDRDRLEYLTKHLEHLIRALSRFIKRLADSG